MYLSTSHATKYIGATDCGPGSVPVIARDHLGGRPLGPGRHRRRRRPGGGGRVGQRRRDRQAGGWRVGGLARPYLGELEQVEHDQLLGDVHLVHRVGLDDAVGPLLAELGVPAVVDLDAAPRALLDVLDGPALLPDEQADAGLRHRDRLAEGLAGLLAGGRGRGRRGVLRCAGGLVWGVPLAAGSGPGGGLVGGVGRHEFVVVCADDPRHPGQKKTHTTAGERE